MSARRGPAPTSLLAAELTKLLTLRSVWVTAVVTLVIVLVAAWSQAGTIGDALRSDDPALAAGLAPETVGFEWVALGLIGIMVVGVLAASSEYTSGQIATSLLAVPDRRRLFLAKAMALALLVTLIGAVTVPALSLLSQRGLGDLAVLDGGIPVSLLLRWIGAIIYWMAMSLIAFSVAMLLRQSLIPLFALIVISQLSLLLLLLTPAFAYLPTIAGVQLFDAGLVTGGYPDAALSGPLAAALTAAWTLALLVLSGFRLARRDA